MRTIITTEGELDDLPVGSVVTSPFPDVEGNTAERMSDRLWLIVGEVELHDSAEMFSSADDRFTVLRHGYDDKWTNIDRGLEITARITGIIAMRTQLKAAFAGSELDGGALAAYDHPLWKSTDLELATLREALMLLV